MLSSWKRTAVSLLIASVCFASIPIIVAAEANNEPKPIFSVQPSESDLEILNSQPKEPEPTAWFVDNNGVASSTPVISKEELNGEITYSSSGEVITPSFVEDYGTYIYSYSWQHYVQNSELTDPYRFFYGLVSLENRTGSNQQLKYSQTNSVSNTWNVSGKVDIETEFRVAMLAKLKANIGSSVSKSWTQQSSSTIESTMTVRPGYIGELSRYKQGAYSGGSGVWKKYKIVKSTGEATDLGFYYETGTAWGICENIDRWRQVEIKL
ncbi:hypothetical protein ACFOQM_22145 [Paenibacillus sp. GCM10012307]|uniref:Uncharacterized protein n=1 Tax=Paenibacillus roseus TaxID=2798579 RepID=A0A934J379_9BACL|nr:hypothetical protein [Paenibacillus roseus]MBJ6363932.1 hypothetical protein [Paenibacillus roseus]